jgi:hypothetical protein
MAGFVLTTALVGAAATTAPNIVLFLTDDQDQMLGGSFPALGGATPMPKARAQLAEQGATATNFFIHTVRARCCCCCCCAPAAPFVRALTPPPP